jgi:hypothetical protein
MHASLCTHKHTAHAHVTYTQGCARRHTASKHSKPASRRLKEQLRGREHQGWAEILLLLILHCSCRGRPLAAGPRDLPPPGPAPQFP